MKSFNLFIVALGLLVLASCKKEDTLNPGANQPAAATMVSDWKMISNWSSEDNSLSSAKISDNAISSDVASGGVVLVYAKSNNVTHALPYSNGGTNWYYQVQQGALTIHASADKQVAIDKEQTFRYIIIPKDQLTELQKTKNVFNLSYDEAMALFSK